VASKKPYKLVDSKEIYRGHVVRLLKDRFILERDPLKLVTREIVDHPGAVVIIPYIDKKHILLIRQFRYAAGGDLWEVPAGTLERGEATLSCAKRELEEETGFRAKKWTLLSEFYPAVGMSNELMTLYKAEGLRPGKKDLDHDEWIENEAVTLAEALRMVKDGRIRDAKTIVSVLWSFLR
jgi:ADP-ribose pyrophosphatase